MELENRSFLVKYFSRLQNTTTVPCFNPLEWPVYGQDVDELTPDKPEPVRLRYRLTVAYDGTLFHGWQKQKLPSSGEWLRTAQGVLEEAAARATKQPVTLVGASRTDAGVHALGQTAQFDAATRIPISNMAAAINSRLPPDMEVRTAVVAAPDFQAIGGAVSKQYRYRIFNSSARPLHRRNYVYHCWWPLDVEAMNAAAKRLEGEHDFTSLAGMGSPRQTNVRTIFSCAVSRDVANEEVHIVVSGSGFLYNMVRILAGTLLEVGRGAMEPQEMDAMLTGCDRRLAGPTLPPEGLWLEWIRYAGDAVDETEAAGMEASGGRA